MAMTTITPASFTRLNSTAPDAVAMRTLETEFRTNTIACGLVVALYENAQALAEAPEIKPALKTQNTFNDYATRALPETPERRCERPGERRAQVPQGQHHRCPGQSGDVKTHAHHSRQPRGPNSRPR